MEDGAVEFWFKNTREKSRWETASLPETEFIDRFLFHVLPKHFHRIRYYGLLANGKAGKQIASIRRLLNDRDEKGPEPEALDDRAPQCPACGNGTMITILVLDGHGNIVKEVKPDTDDNLIPADAGPS